MKKLISSSFLDPQKNQAPVFLTTPQKTENPFLTRELRLRNTSYRGWWGKCVARSMGCKLYANELRSRPTFKLRSMFNVGVLF